MRKIINLVGQKFGRLEVIKFAYMKNGHSYWWCLCNCGNEKIIRGSSLRRGDTKSCGCLWRELNKKHGLFLNGQEKTRLYRIWADMKTRCNNLNTDYYKYYGGKGIKVCKEWNEYIPFRDWALISGYVNNLTIDRKKSDRNYEPSNCQWITQSENTKKANRERRTNKQ